MTTDLLPTVASSMLPDKDDVAAGELPEDDEDDAAGYQAMMKELPTIVSMSGLLDGDFDELNEIQNLLAPVSDDDDIEEGYAAARAAVDAAEASEDAFIQAMVPNPIPTEDFSAGYEVAATAAALDEKLGFSSTAFMTTTTEHPPDSSSLGKSTSLAVRAPVAKRVHKQLEAGLVTPVPSNAVQPLRKKAKLEMSPALAQTPAAIRTSLDGISAPNPLLFGRPIKLPTESTLEIDAPPTNKHKVSLKPRCSPKIPKTSINPPAPVLRKVDPPKLRKPAKFVPPEQILSYPVPAFLVEKMKAATNNRPPLCKLIVKGKVEATLVGTTDAAIARISAPPLKTKPLLGCSSSPSGNNQSASATASKKKASNSKNKKKSAGASNNASISKPKKKVSAHKAKKTVTKNPKANSSATTQESKPSTVLSKNVPEVKPAPPKIEKLMVANPLDNIIAPTESIKITEPIRSSTSSTAAKSPSTVSSTTEGPKTTTATEPESSAPPVVVSSNSSTAGDTPDELTSVADVTNTKQPEKPTSSSSKPLTKEEKAQACRDRNRQHARNTRLRKKAYVEELKHSLMELVEKRDRELEEKKQEQSKKEQHRQTRKKVLQDFLELRGRNERDEAKWEKLVKDSKTFQLRLPVTKFQTMVGLGADASASLAAGEDQVLVGIQDVLADAGYFGSFLQTLGTTNESQQTPVFLEYKTEEGPLLMDGSMGILGWKATSCGAMAQGAKAELVSCGTIQGVFCPDSDKLVSAVLLFDTGIIQAQLPKPLQV